MNLPRITVIAEWDPESQTWVATSPDVPGLVTGAESEEALRRKLPGMIADLVELNNLPEWLAHAPIEILTRALECEALRAG